MFNVERSPAPEILKKERNADNDYKHPEVMSLLHKIFFSKCYLCEAKNIGASIQVDHFIPIKKEPTKKHTWTNLFLSCGHCNGTKSSREDELLDCTNDQHQVYDWLSYEINEFPTEKVTIKALLEEDHVKNTASLLNEIFNGKKKITARALEANHIRRNIRDELCDFNKELEAPKPNISKITLMLSRQSAFSAFKRQIVKDVERFNYLIQYFD